MALRRGASLGAVLLVGIAWQTCLGMRGDRPGQFRLSHFSSYGHKDADHTNDPAFLATNPKKQMTKQLNHAYEFIQPGSREALALHETDRLKTKGLRLRAQSRSASRRARSMSIMAGRSSSSRRSRTRSGSVVQDDSTRARLERFLNSPNTTDWDIMRLLRLYGNRGDEKPPKGVWKGRSRPISLLDRYAPLKGHRGHTKKAFNRKVKAPFKEPKYWPFRNDAWRVGWPLFQKAIDKLGTLEAEQMEIIWETACAMTVARPPPVPKGYQRMWDTERFLIKPIEEEQAEDDELRRNFLASFPNS